MMAKLRNGLLALALLWVNSAFATAITFQGSTGTFLPATLALVRRRRNI